MTPFQISYLSLTIQEYCEFPFQWRARQVHLRLAGVDSPPLPHWEGHLSDVRVRPILRLTPSLFVACNNAVLCSLQWRYCWHSKLNYTDRGSCRPGVEDQPVKVHCDRHSYWLNKPVTHGLLMVLSTSATFDSSTSFQIVALRSYRP